jgi:predicted  nucleic acid-binding Zn-ribbon protein
MLKAEEAQGNRSEAREQLRRARAAWEEEQGRLAAERERLSQEVARLDQERGAAEAQVEPGDLQRYRGVKTQRGTAVAKVERGICRACGLSLPSHELQRARTAQEPVRCGSCGRFLYVS